MRVIRRVMRKWGVPLTARSFSTQGIHRVHGRGGQRRNHVAVRRNQRQRCVLDWAMGRPVLVTPPHDEWSRSLFSCYDLSRRSRLIFPSCPTLRAVSHGIASPGQPPYRLCSQLVECLRAMPDHPLAIVGTAFGSC